MRGDSTDYSTVRLCSCGARFLGLTRNEADAQLARHEERAGCGVTGRGAAWVRRRRQELAAGESPRQTP